MKNASSSEGHHRINRLCAFLVILALVVVPAGCRDDEPENLQIRTWHDLHMIRDNLKGRHVLMNDLDASTAGYATRAGPSANEGKGWIPLGTAANPFAGVFDGLGYEIRDLYIDGPDEDHVGLFGRIGYGGVIDSIGLVGLSIVGASHTGGLVGENGGTVTGSYATGNVTGTGLVGGLIGWCTDGTITSSWFAGNVCGDVGVGGVVGQVLGTLSNCHSEGSVTGRMHVGGLVGSADAIVNCHSTASVTGASLVGGLAGQAYGSVGDSYATGDVAGVELVGGLVGRVDYGDITGSYSTGSVIGDESIGGLVGGNRGLIADCHSTGSVIGVSYVGGLVGHNGYGVVTDSYATGSVSGYEEVGGLVGCNGAGSVNASYATGAVSGTKAVGGLTGCNWGGAVADSYSAGSVTGNEEVGGLMGRVYDCTVRNSHYDHGEVLINGQNVITIGALFTDDFEQWIAQGRFLDIDERLAQEDGYYVLHGVDDFRQLLAFGQDGSLKFILKADLDLAGEANFYVPYLAGVFDGNGHTIKNMTFSSDFVWHVGLFGNLARGGEVSRLGVENADITGATAVGAIVGHNSGTVSSCYSTGSVTGAALVGGLIGENYYGYGHVSNCYSTCSITGDVGVGGLVGCNDYGSVYDSYAVGSVTGDEYVGGLVGRGWSSGATGCFWDTETSGQATSAGGTGKTTAEMKSIATFSGAGWNIVGVASPDIRNTLCVWNVVDGVTYPFLSWQPV